MAAWIAPLELSLSVSEQQLCMAMLSVPRQHCCKAERQAAQPMHGEAASPASQACRHAASCAAAGAGSDTCHCSCRSLLQPLDNSPHRFWGSACDPELLLASTPRQDWSPCHIQGRDIVVPPATGEHLVPNFTRGRNATMFFSGARPALPCPACRVSAALVPAALTRP